MSTINNNQQTIDSLCNRLEALGITGENMIDATKVKEELEDLFTETETISEYSSGAKKLKTQIDKIKYDVQKLEKEAKEILEKISNKNVEIEDKADKVADFATELTKAEGVLQEKVRAIAKSATIEALENVSRTQGKQNFEVSFSNAFGKKLGSLTIEQRKIQTLFNNYCAGSSKISSETSDLQNSLNKVRNLQGKLETKQASITMLKDLEDSMSGMISEKELNLVSANNINISEKLKDGSSRYVFAQGASDDKFHIYDLGSSRGASLARQYGKNQGFDIVENGNGYMYTGLKEVDGETKNSKNVYYFNDADGQKTVGMLQGEYKTISPLSFDLTGDGIQTQADVINYDIDGDGVMDKINDSNDAVLVFDKDKDGIAGADGSECFGNNTDLDGDGKADGYQNGFEALRALALKENLINGADDNVLDVNDIKILEDKYGLGIKKDGYNGETASLIDSGITEINISAAETKLVENFDNKGNKLMTQEGATFKINGEEKQYADIWHQKLNAENEPTDDGRYHLAMGGQLISMNDDLSEITFKTSSKKFEEAFGNLQKNETLQNVENVINELLSKSIQKDKNASNTANIDDYKDEVANLTSYSYLNSLINTALGSAKRTNGAKIEEAEAKDKEEAITDYWGSSVESSTDEKIEEIKEEEKEKGKKELEEKE